MHTQLTNISTEPLEVAVWYCKHINLKDSELSSPDKTLVLGPGCIFSYKGEINYAVEYGRFKDLRIDTWS